MRGDRSVKRKFDTQTNRQERMVNRIFKIMVVLLVLVLTSCDQNPFDKLFNPTGDGALGGKWGYWKIYDDQLNTRGGVMLSPTDEHQTFAEVSGTPHSGERCIKYSWDGTRLWSEKDGKLVNWTAAILIVAPTWREYGQEKDLTRGSYTKITFWVRGKLCGNAKIRFEGPGDYETNKCDWIELSELLAGWQKEELPLIKKTELLQAKEFFKIVFVGGGGTVYVDDITYSK